MTQMKRLRGRPKGSGKSDKFLFEKVSAAMLSNPGMGYGIAIRQLVRDLQLESIGKQYAQPESIVRRLRRKWPREGEAIYRQIKIEREKQEVKPSAFQAIAVPCLNPSSCRGLVGAHKNFAAIFRAYENIAWVNSIAAKAALNMPKIDPALVRFAAGVPRIDPSIIRAMSAYSMIGRNLRFPIV